MFMINFRLIPLFCFALAAGSAQATSTIGKVGTPVVKEGHRAVEARVGYTRDNENSNADQQLRSLQLFDYSFNDTHAMRIAVEQNKLHGDNVEHRAFGIEHWIQFFERRTAGWDGAIRLTYSHRDNDKRPSAAGIRLIGQGPLAHGWSWRQNLIFNRTIGAEQQSSFAFESRTALMRSMGVNPDGVVKSWQLGIESFNDVGRFNALHGYSEQDHQFGPVVNVGFARGINIHTGYRVGISKGATDHNYKLFTSVPF